MEPGTSVIKNVTHVNVTMGFLARPMLGSQQNKFDVRSGWLATAIPLFEHELEREALGLGGFSGLGHSSAVQPSIGANYMSIQPGYGITASGCESCNLLLVLLFLIQI